ncbi:MAG: lipopolysaccharide kinase InaA family protein [Desulfobacterales bacterium]|nr:lipopolysaccharide kinase InaA family protein [Desulfobacterales bacterium]MDX2509181.1 lipopolysaccharide kinase InaA family protein [Desulfobacterales bacterium]
MTANKIKTYDSYNFGFSYDLSDQHLKHLITLFQTPSKTSDSILGGRRSVLIDDIDDIGSVAVKYYHRGGFVRHLIKKRYLKWGKTRSQKEYELLQKVRSLGINAPEPIAFAYRGCLFYQGWLVTKEIKQHQTLAKLSLLNEKRTRFVMGNVMEQISALIKYNILHVDLHPGNVIIDNQDRIYILDFDKGDIFLGNKKTLKNRYIRRWDRAVKKHGLPVMLIELLYSGLRSNP